MVKIVFDFVNIFFSHYAKVFYSGLVPLIDLLNGEYFKRKEEERKLKTLKQERFKIKRRLMRIHQENEDMM